MKLISARPDGPPATTDSSEPVISRDGRVRGVHVGRPRTDPGSVSVVPRRLPDPDLPGRSGRRRERPIRRAGPDLDAAGQRRIRERRRRSPGNASSAAADDVRRRPPHRVRHEGDEPAARSRRPVAVKPTDGDLLDLRRDDRRADASVGVGRRGSTGRRGTRPTAPERHGAHGRVRHARRRRAARRRFARAGDRVRARSSHSRALPSLSLAEADLGTTLVGFASDEWYVSVINDGSSSFQPATVSVSDGRFAINAEESTCTLDVPVPPGGDCTVVLAFTPSSPGPVAATLTVAEEGYQATSVSTRVRGAGGDPTLAHLPRRRGSRSGHRRCVEHGVLLRREEHLDAVDLDQFGDGRRGERP